MAEETEQNIDTFYLTLLNAKFIGDDNQYNIIKTDSGEYGQEVVDVVTEYQWAMNPPNKTGEANVLAAVPYVYAIEFKQTYGATATNLINSLYAIKDSVNDVFSRQFGDSFSFSQDQAQKHLQSHYDSVKSSLRSALGEQAQGAENGGGQSIDFSKHRYTQLNSPSHLLDPYKHLYVLEPTHKQFCFPMLTDSAALSLDNDFVNSDNGGMLFSGVSKTVEKFADSVVSFVSDLQEITNYFSDDNKKSFVMYNIEKAKAYSFPTTGKKINIKFPLFNTTKVDAWKDNYKFIMLFALRNMLFRRDVVTYYPPLIYDVTTAGWGRLPYAYVKQFSVKSCGMIRTMTYNNEWLGIGGNKNATKETTVCVPEAWIIDIQFQSLIADSSNQILSSIYDLPISAKTKEFQTQ